MTTPHAQTTASLTAAEYEKQPHTLFTERELWTKDNGSECVKTVIVDPKGDWFHIDARGPLSELPALLTGPSLTPEETEALRWGIMQAKMHLARTVNPGAAAEYDAFAKGFASLFTRMGAVPSPSTPETGEES